MQGECGGRMGTRGKQKLREIKANLFPGVPIYVAAERLPAVFRVSGHCHFYFRSVADGRERGENRFPRKRFPRRLRPRSAQRGAAQHRLPGDVVIFPPLFLIFPSFYYSSFNRAPAGERRISRVSILRAPRTSPSS